MIALRGRLFIDAGGARVIAPTKQQRTLLATDPCASRLCGHGGYLTRSSAENLSGMRPSSANASIHGCADSGLSRFENCVRVIFRITAASSGAYARRIAPLAASLRFWLAQTEAAWIAFRKRAARFASVSLRVIHTVMEQSCEQTASKTRAIGFRPRCVAIVRYGSGRSAASTSPFQSGASMSGKAITTHV